MGCRYPGAEDLAGFWRLLVEGRKPAIAEVPPERGTWTRFTILTRGARQDEQPHGRPYRASTSSMHSFSGSRRAKRRTWILASASCWNPHGKRWRSRYPAGQPGRNIDRRVPGDPHQRLRSPAVRGTLPRRAIRARARPTASWPTGFLFPRSSRAEPGAGYSLFGQPGGDSSGLRELASRPEALALAGGVNVNLMPKSNVFFSKARSAFAYRPVPHLRCAGGWHGAQRWRRA